MGVRKALQSILVGEGEEPTQIYLKVKLSEIRKELLNDLELLTDKRSLKYFELHKKQDR